MTYLDVYTFIYIYQLYIIIIYHTICGCLFMWWIHRSSWVFLLAKNLRHFWGSSSFVQMIIPPFSGNLCDDTAKPLYKSQTPPMNKLNLQRGLLKWLLNSKDLCVLSLLDTGCSLMCQIFLHPCSTQWWIVATFSGSSSVVAFAWAAVRRKLRSKRASFLCLQVFSFHQNRGFKIIGIIWIYEDSSYYYRP